MKKFLSLAGLLGLGAVSAQAAITVDTTAAVADLGIAFAAILAVVVIVFGYRRIVGLFGK